MGGSSWLSVTLCGVLALATVVAPAPRVVLSAVRLPTKVPNALHHIPALHGGDSDFIYLAMVKEWEDITHVTRYSISTDTFEEIGINFCESNSAVWGGEDVGYCVLDNASHQELWGFQLSNVSNQWFAAELGYRSVDGKAVWDPEEEAVLMIGVNGTLVQKYDVRSGRLDTYAAQFPRWRVSFSAVWAPPFNSAYAFGGLGYFGEEHFDEITRVDPATEGVEDEEAILPRKAGMSCAVWAGRAAYIIGGLPSDPYLNTTILRYDPEAQTLDLVHVSHFPRGLLAPGCAYVERLNRIYIFGGHAPTVHHGEVYYIDLGPLDEEPGEGDGDGPPDCTSQPDGTLLRSSSCCESFYECVGGMPGEVQQCPEGQQFNPTTGRCDPEEIVGCSVSYGEKLEAVLLDAKLPRPQQSMTAVQTGGDDIYLHSWLHSGLFRYSISTETFIDLGSFNSLQKTLISVIDGSAFYLRHVQPIWPFPPRLELRTLQLSDPAGTDREAARVPVDLRMGSLVWDGVVGGNIYIFGGIEPLIYRYNIASGEATELGQLGAKKTDPVAVWVPNDEGGSSGGAGTVYLIGGYQGAGGSSAEIVQFDPTATPTRDQVLNVTLPRGMSSNCAVWTGRYVYLLGGTPTDSSVYSQLIRFDPTANTVHMIPVANFPVELSKVGCTFVESLSRLYVFGGQLSYGNTNQDTVYYIELPPAGPPPDSCEGQAHGAHVPSSTCCDKYYYCFNEFPLPLDCPTGTHFSPVTRQCELPEDAACGLAYNKSL